MAQRCRFASRPFRNERATWKIVTAHLSLGVPDTKLTKLLPELLG
jgi:hypothetical protein